jgi:hypothetical protein
MNLTSKPETSEIKVIRFGFYTAIATAAITFITFAIAVNTPPYSGPFCLENCYEYPYHDIASRFPRDYFWMYSAMLMVLTYLMLMVCIHHYPSNNRKIYSQMGLALAVIAVMILFSTYFVQVSVVQPSLLNNETEGIALITQFNPHGIFIAMEEAGYILMNLSFLFLVPVFVGKGKLAKSIRVIFIAFFVLALLSFILVSVKHGVMREYIYEVIIISIVYLELIIAPILLAAYFKYDINKYL